jgi:glycosyltransferase involved in cell wall biosynthesis/GT2 family glycosyltransferase
MAKVSVIISTYNREKYLPESVQSVLNQTFRDFELIVIDDGSIDDTKNIVINFSKMCPDKIKYFNQEHKGQAAALNRGIKEAKGEYVAFLDSDDIWLPNKLEVYLNYFNSNYEIALIGSRMGVIDDQGKKIDKLKPMSSPGSDFKSLIERGGCSTSSLMVRKIILENLSFNEQLRKHTDLDICLKVSDQYKIQTLDQVLALYREHDESTTSNKISSYQGQIEFWLDVISRYKLNIDVKFCRKKISYLYYLLGREYSIIKDYKNSVKNIASGLKYNLFLGKEFWKKGDLEGLKFIKLIKPDVLFFVNIFKSMFLVDNNRNEVRILFYESSSGFGGSSRAVSYIIDYLDYNKFHPFLVIKNYGPQFDKIKKVVPIKLKSYRGHLNIISEVLNLLRLITSKKISIVHINTNISTGIPAILAAKLTGVFSVCHIRETRALIKRERIFSHLVDKFIILNKDALLIYNRDIKKDKLSIIYDGLDLEEFKDVESNFRQEFNLDSHPIVAVLGRIVEGKGQKEFVLACREAIRIIPRAKFLIIGEAKGAEDAYYNDLIELVYREGLDKNVIFTGWRNDIANVISSLDVLVLPSTTYKEGLPNSIIEAMALSKPVVATDIAGPSDIVADGETGFLVPAGDIKAMAEKIVYLLNNPDIAKRMGEVGRKRAQELFDIKKQVKKIEAIYEEVLSHR